MRFQFSANLLSSIAIMVVGVLLAVAGIMVGEADDAPGAAFIGLVLMAASIYWGTKRLRK